MNLQCLDSFRSVIPLMVITGLIISSCKSDGAIVRERHGIELPTSANHIRHSSARRGSDWVEISVFEMDNDELQDFFNSLPMKDGWIPTFKKLPNEVEQPIDKELAEELLDPTLTSLSGILRHRFQFDSPTGEFGLVSVHQIENDRTVVRIRTWSD
jgi:hypothetical protein